MTDRTGCLHPSAIHAMFEGTLPEDEIETVEKHLAVCSSCRNDIESSIGSQDWWSDVKESFSESISPNRHSDFDGQTREQTDVSQQLLSILGPTDDPAMLGRIGPYEIVALLGTGGMGAVFKGLDRSLNRFVAIKVLLPNLAVSGAARKRFEREGKAIAAVIDDHVMAVHCVDQWQGIPYLVMQYCRGNTLQQRIDRDGPLQVCEILRIALQTARGLAAAHAQGIVHRDIKPANVFLDDKVERVQLMDFGLARAADDASLTRSGVLAGTPQYMSPEQARAEVVDARSDLFSLGAVLYAMCTGHGPFRAESSHAVLRLITDRQPRSIREINPDIPVWLVSIIQRLMSKQAEDRYESANALADLLESCLAHVQEPTRIPLPAELVSPPSKPTNRLYSLKGLRTMLGAVGAIALGTLLLTVTSPPDIGGRWQGDGWNEVVLEQADGKGRQFTGTFLRTDGGDSGMLALKWSRTEQRFNGTWTDDRSRSGRLSLRLDGDEIRGAITTNKSADAKDSINRLADLHWQRVPIGADITEPTNDY
ncbi:MAG: protein kinase, partial [Pirellulaceae bacterium]